VTTADPGGSRLSRLAPRNWSLPVKLTAVLAVPVILALTLGGMRVRDQIHNAADLGAHDRYIVMQDRVSTLIGQLQRERDQSAIFVGGDRTGDRSTLKSVFGAVDSGLTDTETAIGNPTTLPGAPQAAYARVKDALSRLISLRDQVTAFGVDPGGVVARYTGLIEPLLVFESSLDHQLNAPGLAGSAAALSALNNAREQVALQHAVVSVAIARGDMLPPDADTVRATDARLGTAIDQFLSGLDPGQQQRLAGWTTGSELNQLQKLKQTGLSRVSAPGQLGISQADWDSAYQAVLDELHTSESGLRDDIRRISAAQQASARNDAGVNSVILLLSMLAAAAVVYLIGRSMLKPLRVLRRAALDVADRRLPEAVAAMREGKAPDVKIEPVPVTTREEIGQVARAFDAVHGQAVRLAAEQATLQAGVSSMFINLSRRSQGLVERQLRLIEQLERNEQDSEQLANLFQLDHLATRMRRNSENLLVLAGSDLAKRANQAVPVVDVLRAAVSETEQYQRVVVQTTPDVQIMGRAASDLVHLIAELLDNATSFSPPDTQVVVSSTRTPDGSVLMEIADQGVGMPGEDLISANNRLSGPAEVNVSTSRRMGLFVVGRLASRHGIGVRLASSDPSRGASSGVTASVNVPNYLISGALSNTEALEAVKAARPEGGGRSSYTSRTERTELSGAPANGLAAAGAAAGAAGAAARTGPAAGAGGAANGRGGDGPQEQDKPGLPSRRPGAAAASFGAGSSQAAGSAEGAGPVAGQPAAAGSSQAAGSPAAAAAGGPAAGPSAGSTAAQVGGAPAAPGAEGGLPRRAAGAALAGPLASRTAPPSVPAARTSSPPAPHRDAPAETTGGQPRTASIGGPGRVPGGALRSPDGLRSLRTPSAPPAQQEDRERFAEAAPSTQQPYDPQPQAPQQRHRREDGPTPGTVSHEPPGGERSLQAPPMDDRSRPAWDSGEQGHRGGRGWEPGHTGEQPRADDWEPRHTGEQPRVDAWPPAGEPGGEWAPDEYPDAQAVPDGHEGHVGHLGHVGAQSGYTGYAGHAGYQDTGTGTEWQDGQSIGGAQPMWPDEQAIGGAQPMWPDARTDGEPLPVWPADQPVEEPVGGYRGQDDYAAQGRSGDDQYGQSPIFEEMASAWFRDNWDVTSSPEGTGLVPAPEVPAPPLPAEPADGWASGDGWDSGEPLLQPFTQEPASEYTPVGLPKRRRGAHLIPGAAATSQAKAEPAPAIPVPTRSAEQVRNRLGSYQQGVRAGRKHRLEDRISEQDESRNEETG